MHGRIRAGHRECNIVPALWPMTPVSLLHLELQHMVLSATPWPHTDMNASQREVMKPGTQTFCTCVKLYMEFLQAKQHPGPYNHHCQTEDRNLKRSSAPHLVTCPSIPHLSLVPEFNHASFSNKYFTGGKFSKQSHEGVWVAGERTESPWEQVSACGSAPVAPLDAWDTIVKYNLHSVPAASPVTHILCFDTEGASF